MKKCVYAVVLDGHLLKCIDTSNGSILGSINVVEKILTHPIVIEDRCTVIFESKKGVVYKLPSFGVSTTFDT